LEKEQEAAESEKCEEDAGVGEKHGQKHVPDLEETFGVGDESQIETSLLS